MASGPITSWQIDGETVETVKVRIAQSCLTLCDPMDYTIHGILQAIRLEWVAFPFSSCPQSFPASGSFPVSQLFASGGQNIGASASVLPMNIQR